MIIGKIGVKKKRALLNTTNLNKECQPIMKKFPFGKMGKIGIKEPLVWEFWPPRKRKDPKSFKKFKERNKKEIGVFLTPHPEKKN